jgi:hypothetical protein
MIVGPTDGEIDAGAAALRKRMCRGKITRTWDQISNSQKRKWREYAAVVLQAALKEETGS